MDAHDPSTSAPASNVDSPSAASTPDSGAQLTADTTISTTSSTMDSVILVSPGNLETLIDLEHQIWVGFTTAPAASLPKDMTAHVRLDVILVVSGGSNRLPLDVSEREAHQLQVQLVDATGSTVARTVAIEIIVKLRFVSTTN